MNYGYLVCPLLCVPSMYAKVDECAEKCRLFLILKTKYLSQMCGRWRDGERGSNEPFMELIWAFSKSLASSGGLVKNMP